jgi:hypothetical protein
MRKLLLLIVLVPRIVLAQKDSSILREALTNAFGTDSFNQEIYNGKAYLGYSSASDGIAFYRTSDWQEGSIVYGDIFYPNVFLKYDLYQNEVVIRHYNGYSAVTLFTPRIQSFSIGNAHFVNLPAEKTLPPGIYEELVMGKVSLYAKRSKSKKENIAISGIEQKFVQQSSFYVKKENVYYPAKTQSEIMELMKDKKNEIKAHFKANKIRFKRNQEAVLIEMVRYYNQITL